MTLEAIILWPLACVLFVIMGTGLYIFSIMAGEIFKLGFFPMMVFGNSSQHRSYAHFWRYMLSFLQTARDSADSKLRLALTNKYLLQQYFKLNPKQQLTSMDAMEVRARQEKFCRKDVRTVTFTEMHGFNNGNDDPLTCADVYDMCCVEGCQKNWYRWITCECLQDVRAEECFVVTMLVPYDVLSAIFTIFFPIIAMCLTPRKDWTVLQEALTFIYSAVLFIVIILSMYVYKYFRMTSSIFAPVSRYSTDVVDNIIAYWKDFIGTNVRDQIIENYFMDIAPTILEFAGEHRVYDIEWVPPVSWQTAGEIDGTYVDWTDPDRLAEPEFIDRLERARSVELVLKVDDHYGKKQDWNGVWVTDSEFEDEKEASEGDYDDHCSDDEKEMEITIVSEYTDATDEFQGNVRYAQDYFKNNIDDRCVRILDARKGCWYENTKEEPHIFQLAHNVPEDFRSDGGNHI